MKMRRVRCTVRSRYAGIDEESSKESDFTMSDDRFSIVIEPPTSLVTLTVGLQTETGTLSTLALPMTIVLPLGSASQIGSVSLPLVPNMVRIVGQLTEVGPARMQVHIVETHVSFHGLQLVHIPHLLCDLERLEIEIQPL